MQPEMSEISFIDNFFLNFHYKQIKLLNKNDFKMKDLKIKSQ